MELINSCGDVMKQYLFLLLIPLMLYSKINEDWNQIVEREHITIYEKREERFNFSQFKGETSLPYSVQQISKVIMRPLSYPEWLADCIHAKRLFTATLKVHLITQPPWPLKPRQVNVIIKKKKRGESTVITFNSLHQQTCIKNYNAIWFNFLHAEFTLLPQGKNRTLIRLELAADPGGYIPNFLVDATGWMIPYQSLRDLRNYLQRYHKGNR